MTGGGSELEYFLYFAEELALAAIDRIGKMPPFEDAVSTKRGPADFVTRTDRDVERLVRDAISERWSSHRVEGEEFGATGPADADYVWYVDPIDGTTNFVHGLGWFSFSLGLCDRSGAAVGVVADPSRREVFGAARGHGTRLDGRPVECRSAESLAGAVVLTEWAGHRPWHGMSDMLAQLSSQSCTTRIMGSSALSIASVAAGRAAAAVVGDYNRWDVVAAIVVAREAGAIVLGRDGREHDVPPSGGGPDSGLLAVSAGVAAPVYRAWTGRDLPATE